MPAHAGALQDHDVTRAVCKNDGLKSVLHVVVWMTTDLVLIGHASISGSGCPCQQQQQPDGHASAWTEKPWEAVQPNFCERNFT